MNHVELIGRITADIDLKFTSSGAAMAKTSLAINRRLSKEKLEQYKKENKATADFPRIVFIGNLAEHAAKYLSKGSLVAVEGSLSTGSYENAEGHKIYTTEVLCERLHFLEPTRKTNDPLNSEDMSADLFEIEDVSV